MEMNIFNSIPEPWAKVVALLATIGLGVLFCFSINPPYGIGVACGAIIYMAIHWGLRLVGLGDVSVDPMVTVLKARDYSYEKDREVLRAAQEVLVGLGSSSVEPLIALLKSPLKELQIEYIVKALGEIGDPRAVKPLAATLMHRYSHQLYESPSAEATAAWALGRIDDVRVVKPLVMALSHGNTPVRKGGAVALRRWFKIEWDIQTGWRIGLPVSREVAHKLTKAVPELMKGLDDDRASARCNAAEALEAIGSNEAVPALITALADKNERVRTTCARALRKIGTPEALEGIEEYEKKQLA